MKTLYINNESLIETKYYKYLSIVFTSRLCWSTALRTLACQGNKAIYTIKFINREFSGLPVKLLFDLFKKMALTILLYGCEIWGYTV